MIRTTERITRVLLMAILTAFFSAVGVSAQIVDYETAKGAIERTDEVIAEAKIIIGESRSQIARISLDKAVALQEQARSFFVSDRYAYAHKYTMDARYEAWHAIALAREDARIEEKLLNLQEETRERLMRLRTRIMENEIKDAPLFRLMDEARDLLEKSLTNAVQLRSELAMNLAENARRIAVQAEERFRRVLTLKEMVERRLTLVERFIERVRDRAIGDPGDRDSAGLEHAVRMTERSHELIRNGSYNAARATIMQCEKIVRALVRDMAAQDGSDPESMLAEATRLHETAARMIQENEDISSGSAGMADRALELLDKARGMIDSGKPEEAEAFIEEARLMLRRALQPTGGDVDGERLRSMIENMVEMRETTRQMISECSTDGAASLFERASRHLDQAISDQEKGDLNRAYAEAGIARNIYQRIREICAR